MKNMILIMLLALGIACIAKKSFKCDSDSAKAISHLLEKRHSGYSYNPQKQVSIEQIKTLINAARLASSSYNEQPWNFIICDKATNPEAYNKVFSTLVEFNQNWVKDVQILVIIAYSKNSKKDKEPNAWAQYDTGAAAFSMAIQAVAQGLMTHQMGGFDRIKLAEIFNLPEDIIPISIMAIGYEDLEKSKPKPKERKSINENFFLGNWGNSF